MMQKYFFDNWLLPCSLRSHRTANPRPKIGYAIFRLCPPTTLRVREVAITKFQKIKNELLKKKYYFCVLENGQ